MTDAPQPSDNVDSARDEARDDRAMTEHAKSVDLASTEASEADGQVFRAFSKSDPQDDADQPAGPTASRDLDLIREIPVTLSVALGATRLSIRELLDLTKGSIVELDGLAGEPMDILINGYLVANGEVVVVDDKYGVRITDIVDKAERIGKLSR